MEVLKRCAKQLYGVFQNIFSPSLRCGRVPTLWKISCLVPVPRKVHPKVLNVYRPMVLTSHMMKTLERLVLSHLRPLGRPTLDPLQFAYKECIGVDGAIIYLLHCAYSHLDEAGGTVKIMFLTSIVPSTPYNLYCCETSSGVCVWMLCL